ncbi:MAG: transglutaminase-like cysteine peptidase [Anaerolineales bacterium]|nr:transglutaminase-like cysteine peptidase [Anaerolineales bacterium]
MIVPVMMIKRFEYGRFFRILWLILFPFTLFMLGLVWAIWPDSGFGWRLLVESFILLYSLYAGWSLWATFGSVELTSSEVRIRQLGRERVLPYEAIQKVWRNELALFIKTNERTIFLERHLDGYRDLIDDLKNRAPALQINSQAQRQQPLPQTFYGRFEAFLFSLFITLLCGSMGTGIIWSAFDESGFQMVLMFFFGLWPLLISGLFLYLSFTFTWQMTLLPDKVVLRFTFHKHEIPVEHLASVRLLTIKSNRSPEPTLVLVLTLADGRSRHISQQVMPIPLPQLMDMMSHHYQLPRSYEKEATRVHHTEFGAGSRRPFSHYLNGESRVMVQSLDDICRWLQQCEYVRDSELFGQRDVWQHPGEFETRRKGDCEDHALWAWRKLKELNIPAEFVVGRTVWSETNNGVHAWVAFEENGRSYILESTNKKQLIFPLETIQTRYHPWFSVDMNSQTYRFAPVATRES